MTVEEAERRLRLFGILGKGEGEDDIRKVLARILARGSLVLSDMQTVRDVMEHLKVQEPGLCLFLAAMQLSLKDGNTFLRLEKGAELLKAAGHQEDGQDQEKYDGLVVMCWSKYAKAAGERLAQGDGQLVVCKDVAKSAKGWFFAKVWDSVNAVSDRLKAMSDEKDLEALPEGSVKRAVPFLDSDEQQEAVRTVGKRRLTVVTGGPGTGKTTIICAILRTLMERGDVIGEDVALVAPTGRAGQRMGESIHDRCREAGMPSKIAQQIEELSGATIHSTLGGLPPNWKYTKDNRLPYKLVIVDEASMVDVHMMRALLDALPEQCRLVLLGDKDQLPSVDAGAVLGDVVSNFDERTVVELKKSHRFMGALADCARAVNEGDVALFEQNVKKLPGVKTWTETMLDDDNVNSVFLYKLGKTAKPEVFRKLILEWVRCYGLISDPADKDKGPDQANDQLASAAEKVDPTNDVFKNGTKTKEVSNLFKLLDRSRILTVVREGPFGAAGINDLVVTERFGGRRPTNPLAKVGVPVMVTRNTRERNLWNGDIGVTVKGPNGMTVLFPRGDKVTVCPVGLLPEHELAYAMTVHKSQGSEFENVLVVLPNDVKHPLLNRQIVYTGITRAKKRVVLIGIQEALNAALKRKIERDTGI